MDIPGELVADYLAAEVGETHRRLAVEKAKVQVLTEQLEKSEAENERLKRLTDEGADDATS